VEKERIVRGAFVEEFQDELGKYGRAEMGQTAIAANGDEINALTEITIGCQAGVATVVGHTSS
jgi:hypothetical protein